MAMIGAFVSTAGGMMKMLDRADDLGVDSIMMFASSPQSWNRRVFAPGDMAAFRRRFTDTGYHSLWIHGTYLINFGTANPALLRKSIDALVLELEDAARLGARGVIFHLGSHTGRGFDSVLDQIVTVLREVLERSSHVGIVLENSAGMGGSIGARLEDLAHIYERVADDRLQFCFDTQHAFAAGYPIHQREGLAAYLEAIDRLFGLQRLVALHANDSKVPFSGGRDRHENIGAGYIGESGWQVLTHERRLRDLPFLLEVPGDNHAGPDKPNVDRLRSIADTA